MMAKRTWRRASFAWLLAAMLVTMLSGCSKVNKENYDKLKVGLDYSEVVTILGSPTECKDVLGTRNCEWGSDSKSIAVKFVADKAILYSSNGLQ